ncbi:MAG: ADP-ribosylglycohydrolase family protein, partial [Thermodesulfobacteriota bacterium]
MKDHILGCLLGAAVGDALGLPLEGISRRRQVRMFPDPGRYHFFFGRGMVSDDTEHLAMTAGSLIASAGDEARFARDLAWRLRFWLARLPAGVGLATLRSILKLWVGFSPDHSGVYSAGNGPAMRSSIIGLCFGHDPEKMRRLVRISTRMTHSDPKAEYGALAVALAAYYAAVGLNEPDDYLKALSGLLGPEGEELAGLAQKAAAGAGRGASTEAFAASLGLEKGVSGYMYHTVPVALQAWFRHPADFRAALTGAIRCGGDTDTVASILGGIIGAGVGPAGIPAELIEGLLEWPLTP